MKLTLTGHKAVIDRLHGIGDRAGVMPEVVGKLTVFAIKQRTQKGAGVDGGTFAPYAKMTKELRKEAGLQTGHVDLTFTGKMFAALKQKTAGARATIYFDSTKERNKAARHQEGDPAENLPQRRFFGLDSTIVGAIREYLAQWIMHGKHN